MSMVKVLIHRQFQLLNWVWKVSLGFWIFFNLAYGQQLVNRLPFAHPHLMNPSTCGLMDDKFRIQATSNVIRAVVVSENQKDLKTALFNQQALTMDYNLKSEGLKGGIGAHFSNESQAGLRISSAYSTFAYQVPFGPRVRYNQLRAGFQAGIIQYALDNNDLTFEDQFNTRFFINPTQERLQNFSVFIPDINLSLLYIRKRKVIGNPELNYFVGGSIHHINRPVLSFFDGSKQRLNQQYRLLAGTRIRTRIPVDFTIAHNISVGDIAQNHFSHASVHYAVHQNKSIFEPSIVDFYLGTNINWFQDLSPFIGLTYLGKYSIAFSTSIVTSDKLLISNRFGGISIFAGFRINNQQRDNHNFPLPVF
jgi:type IX secretion system PorP/SprF family membrane protein